MKLNNPWVVLIGLLALNVAVAAAGAAATDQSVRSWYPTLTKPAWTPPAWMFGPVWTILYTVMAVAAWLVWRRAGFSGGRWALTLYAVQLALNAAWSPLFFGLRSPLAGLVDIVFLWFAIAVTTISFWRLTPLAGWLLVPYLLWVTLATALNFTLWRLNA